MTVLWIACMFLGTLCAAQNNIFSQSSIGGSPFPAGGSSVSTSGSQQLNQFPGTLSSSVSGSASAGPSGTGASASTTIITPQPYPACLSSNPDDGVQSQTLFAFSLLESTFTNPFLKTFYNTSFNTAGFYDAVYEEVKETLPKDKSQLLAGSFAVLFETVFPKITPLLNAVSMTNALSEIFGEEGIVIRDNKEDYIGPFMASVSEAISDSDGSANSQAKAVVFGLLNYLDYANVLSYAKLHEFVNILAGEYYMAIYSTCKPSSFESIPLP